MLLLGLEILLVFICIIWFRSYWNRDYQQLKGIPPGPPRRWLFGNLLDSGILTGKKTFTEVILEYQRQYGDCFTFWFGSSPMVTFCSMEAAQQILSDRHTFDQSPLFLPNFDLICPHSIFMPTGPKWKRHIRVMLPMFKRAKIRHHADVIAKATDKWIARYFHQDGVHQDIFQYAQSLTMNVIGWIGFDYDFESTMDPLLKESFQNFAYYSMILFITPWIPRWIQRLYLKYNWTYQDCRRRIRDLIEKIVEQEMKNPERDEHQRPKNLIASLVSSLNEEANDEQIASGLTRDEMLDEVLVSILAGYETTSTGLTWLIFYLSKNPHVQQRIHQELQEHHLLAADGDDELPTLTYEQLDELVYCEAVIKETLRLAPIASVTTRLALDDTTVEGVRIHRGQNILIALNHINTNSKYWHHTDPKSFAPERFLGDDQHHESFAWLPFGGGHRACMGQDLAWFELKVILVRSIQQGLRFNDTPENTGGYAEKLTCYPKRIAVRVSKK